MGLATLGNGTFNIQKGANVTDNTASLTLGTVALSAGFAGTTTFNPTTASLSLGAVSSTSNQAKTLELSGTSTGNTVTGAITNGTNVVSLLKSGAGAWTLSNAGNTFTGAVTVSAGVLNISGSLGTNTANGNFRVGTVANTAAVLNILPGAVINNRYNMFVGDAGAGTGGGAVYQSGGSLTLTQAASVDNLRIGSNAGGYGYYNLSGGTLTTNEVGVGASLNGTVGVLDISGGVLTDTGYLSVSRGGTNSSGVLNMTGGAITFGQQLALNVATTTAGAQGVVNVQNGTITGPNSATLGVNLAYGGVAGTLGAVNLLSGGTLTTGVVTAGTAAPTALLNFNGGTLKATATNAGTGFLTSANIDGVYVYGGGGTIDNNGTAITVGTPLLAPTGNGINTNPTVATGGAGYIGAPMVTISGGGGTGATAVATVSNGVVTGITITNPGVGYTSTPTFTLTGGGATTAATLTGAAPTANASGGMTFTGSGITTLSGANTYTGPTTINTGATLQLGTGASGADGTISSSLSIVDNGALIFNRFGSNSYGGVISNIGSVTKTGAGTQALTNANTYTGATNITVGTLTLDHSGANTGALGNTAVTVGSGATLLVKGSTTIGSAPGGTLTSAGTVSLQDTTANTLNVGGGITFNTSALNFDLNPGGPQNADLIAASGVASGSGTNTLNLKLLTGTVFPTGSSQYTLITAAGGLSGVNFAFGTKPAGFNQYVLTDSSDTAEVVTVTANAAANTEYWTGVASRTGSPADNIMPDTANNWGFGSGFSNANQKSNWSTNQAGSTDALQVPEANTDTYFTAQNATPDGTGALSTQLDGAYNIKGLFLDTSPQAAFAAANSTTAINAVGINTNGYTLTFGADGLTVLSADTSSTTISNTGAGGGVLLNGNQTWANNSATLPLTVSAGITGNAAAGSTNTLTFAGSGAAATNINGVIGNGVQGGNLGLVVTKTGGGVLTLNAVNTFTGGITLNSGILQVGVTGALNANAVTFGAGSTGDLRLNGVNATAGGLNTNTTVGTPIIENANAATNATLTDTVASGAATYAGVVQDGGTGILAFTKTGAGTQVMSGANTYTGGTNINGGLLNVGSAETAGTSGPLGASGVINFGGGTLQYSAANQFDYSSRFGTGAQTISVDTNGQNVTFASPINSTASFTKLGAGTLTIGNGTAVADTASDYFTRGGTTVIGSGATLTSAAYSSFGQLAGDRSIVTINNGGKFVGGDLNVADVGGTNAATSDQAILNLNSATTNSSVAGLFVGKGTSTTAAAAVGVLNQTAGTFTASNNTQIGTYGQGQYNLSGGTLAHTGGFISVGRYAGGFGTVDVNGGALNDTSAGARTIVGESGTGVLNVRNGGVLNVSETGNNTGGNLTTALASLTLGNTTGGNGTVNLLTGGTINTTSVGGLNNGTSGGTVNTARYFVVGSSGTASVGTATIDGTLNVRNVAGTVGNLEVSTFDTAVGTLNIHNGSTIRLDNNSSLVFGAVNNTATGSVNQTGGNVGFYSDSGTTSGSTGLVTLGVTGTGAYTYNLSGGTLTANGISRTSATGSGTFNFNGGTLQAAGSTATFIQRLTTANVQSGGAIIDTNGFNDTIAQALVHDTTSGAPAADGGLTKNGAGVLTLTATNTYTGATNVNVGTLRLANTGGQALTDGGNIAVNNGSVLALAADNQVAQPATSTVTLMNSSTLKFDTTAITTGTTGYTATLGALNVDPSTIDFGANAAGTAADGLGSTFTFANSAGQNWLGITPGAASQPDLLKIMNYDYGGVPNVFDHLYFGTAGPGLTQDQLASIRFVNPNGAAPGTYAAAFSTANPSEVILGNALAPTPEPGSVVPILVGMAGLGILIARKRRKTNAENCQNELAEAV